MFTDALWFYVNPRAVLSFRISFPWGLRIEVNNLSYDPGHTWWQPQGPEFLGCQVGLATAASVNT